MDSHVTHSIEIPPALAKAIVAAQAAGESLRRDSTGDKGKYTTADEIAFVARKVLTEHGAAWVRLDVSLESRALAESDIGKQSYVGDVVERWAIVHEGGGVLLGSSRMPVITSMGRPHDKAVGASLTYDVGGALRGALCMDREDKNAIDRRADEGPGEAEQPAAKPNGTKPQREPDVTPAKSEPRLGKSKKGAPLVDAIHERMMAAIDAMQWEPVRVWRTMLATAGVDVAWYVREDGQAPIDETALRFKDAPAVKAALDAKLAEFEHDGQEGRRDDAPPINPKDDCARLWVQLRKLAPNRHTDESWRADWAKFAGINLWPERPSIQQHQAAADGMRAALQELAAP
jgi:hypothetical protein